MSWSFVPDLPLPVRSEVAISWRLGVDADAELGEDPAFLTKQLVTYIGNKRSLAGPLTQAVMEARCRLGGRRLRSLDLFSGSGFVSRLLKRHSSLVAANDLELYARALSECFLPDRDDGLLGEVAGHVERLNAAAAHGASHEGFIRELYSPADDQQIRPGERVFYSNDNARRLDYFVQELALLPGEIRRLLLGPLLSSASIHVNTGGVFKGFYKDKETGIGKFGATAGHAMSRILAPIELAVPMLSRFKSADTVYQEDANALVRRLEPLDLVYLDPPYNQHPYGSNYFMLNVLTDYQEPQEISRVSGIPTGWNRSGYNVRKQSLLLLEDLFSTIPARFLVVSFNSEGHVSTAEIRRRLERQGRVDEQIVGYTTYRASRNLHARDIHVSEHVFLLDREG